MGALSSGLRHGLVLAAYTKDHNVAHVNELVSSGAIMEMRREDLIPMKGRHYWVVWVLWVSSTALSTMFSWLLVAMSAYTALIFGSTVFIGLTAIIGVAAMIGTGVLTWSIIGLAQGWTLGRKAPIPTRHSLGRQWQVATMRGGSLGTATVFLALFFSPPVFLGLYRYTEWRTLTALLAFMMGGLVLGVVQHQVLNLYVRNSAWWIPANALGWGIGWYIAHNLVGELVAQVPSPEGGLATGFLLLISIETVLIITIATALTGFLIAWLLQQPRMRTDL